MVTSSESIQIMEAAQRQLSLHRPSSSRGGDVLPHQDLKSPDSLITKSFKCLGSEHIPYLQMCLSDLERTPASLSAFLIAGCA